MRRIAPLCVLLAALIVIGCGPKESYASGACVNKDENWAELPGAFDIPPFGLDGPRYYVLALGSMGEFR